MKGTATPVHQWNTADTITAVRMAASVFLLFFPLGSAAFLVVYTLTGLTDALVRLAGYAVAAIRYRRFTALHTRLNKLTGAAVFLLPYVLAVSPGVAYGWAVCTLAFAAALEELAIHLHR